MTKSVSNPDLDELLAKAKAEYEAMTPKQRAEMMRQQAIGFARAEAAFGSDADEAEYRAATASGDAEAIADCERKAQERMARFDALTKDLF